MNNFACKCFLMGVGLLLTAIWIGALDVGGGSGKPLTPYDDDKQESVSNVTELYNVAGGLRMVRNVKLAGTAATRTAYRMGFEFLDASGVFQQEPDRSLQGTDSSGKAFMVDLARLESLKLLSSTSDEVRMSITLFPDITPEKLLAIQPSYTDLSQRYRTTSVIRVPCQRADGRKLFLVGTTWSGTDKLTVAILISSLQVDEVIQIREDFGPPLRGPWWAIQSVTKDPTYPYRLFTKK